MANNWDGFDLHTYCKILLDVIGFVVHILSIIQIRIIKIAQSVSNSEVFLQLSDVSM